MLELSSLGVCLDPHALSLPRELNMERQESRGSVLQLQKIGKMSQVISESLQIKSQGHPGQMLEKRSRNQITNGCAASLWSQRFVVS